MEKLPMFKCSACGRIKVGHKWLYLTEVKPDDHKAKLSWLIVVDGVDWTFIHCGACASKYQSGRK